MKNVPAAPPSTEPYSFSLCEYAGFQNLISNYQIINAWGRLGPRILCSLGQSNNGINFTCILFNKSPKNNSNQKYTLFTISKTQTSRRSHIYSENICYKPVALQSQTQSCRKQYNAGIVKAWLTYSNGQCICFCTVPTSIFKFKAFFGKAFPFQLLV